MWWVCILALSALGEEQTNTSAQVAATILDGMAYRESQIAAIRVEYESESVSNPEVLEADRRLFEKENPGREWTLSGNRCRREQGLWLWDGVRGRSETTEVREGPSLDRLTTRHADVCLVYNGKRFSGTTSPSEAERREGQPPFAWTTEEVDERQAQSITEVGNRLGLTHGLLPLSDWLRHLAAPRALPPAEVLGHGKCYVLEWDLTPGSPIKTRAFVSPLRRFAVVRLESIRSDTHEVLFSRTTDAWRETAPGIWLPEVTSQTVFVPKEALGSRIWRSKTNCRLGKVQVNVDLPEDAFELDLKALPKGTQITDWTEQRTYVVGEEPFSDKHIEQLAALCVEYRAGKRSVEDLLAAKFPNDTGAKRLCGPHVLALVCAMFGVKTTVDELSKLTNADANAGVTLLDLVRAAQTKGLHPRGVELTAQDLRAATSPTIVAVKAEHFVVCLGFTEDKILLVDPPARVVALPLDDWDKIWSRKAVLFEDKLPAPPR